MKQLICGIFILFSFNGFSQHFILGKESDTLHIGDKDSLISIPFVLEGTNIDINPKLIIKVHSGTALVNRDFVLRDAYNTTTNEINITNVENKSGNFKIFVIGGIKESKSINFQVTINDNAKMQLDIAKVILSPLTKKPPKDEKPKVGTKDSISFLQFQDININVYNDKGYKVELNKQNNPNGYDGDDKLINIYETKITQSKPNEYLIEITTTDNEIYYSTIQITNEYKFKIDDKLYLNGNLKGYFIHAGEFFLIKVERTGQKTKTLNENNEIKFQL